MHAGHRISLLFLWCVGVASLSSAAAPPFKVVGYYPQWGMFNTPAYNVKNLISSGTAPLLTHLVYAFSDIENNRCATYDNWADYLQPLPATLTVNGVADVEAPGMLLGNFHQLQELKSRYPALTIEMSIGGGAMPASVFSQAAMPANRQAFVASCISMYIQGNFAAGLSAPGIFTGVDIDWEFPGSATDQANYIALLQEFRNQLDALGSGYTLTATGGTWWGQWDYMNPNVAQSIVDFFNIPMYDFDGPWNSTTGFIAPLTQSSLDPNPANNLDYVVQQYLALGVERQKMVFGMPLYGYRWMNASATQDGLFEPGVADHTPHPYRNITWLSGFTKYRDSATQEPWLYNPSTHVFWTYDDATSLAFKTRYVVNEGLGGVMFWELSGDTANGSMVKAVVAAL